MDQFTSAMIGTKCPNQHSEDCACDQDKSNLQGVNSVPKVSGVFAQRDSL